MKIEVITENLSYLEIATRQLDRAIALYLIEKDFISSLTLAGAAEEILGKLLNESGQHHALNYIIEGALKLNGMDSNAPEAKSAEKEIANLANYYKNRLKHYNSENTTLNFSVDYYSADIIDRAISNYFAYTSLETELMVRFKNEVLLG